MRMFKEPLRALVAGVPQVLAQLSGACTGASVLLASDSIPFGSVVLGSRTTKRLQLSNVGDVGCQFVWDTYLLAGQFSISPAGEMCKLLCMPQLALGCMQEARVVNIKTPMLCCPFLCPCAAHTDNFRGLLGTRTRR